MTDNIICDECGGPVFVATPSLMLCANCYAACFDAAAKMACAKRDSDNAYQRSLGRKS